MNSNLKSMRSTLPESLDSSITALLPQITDPDLKALLSMFKVSSLSLEADGEPLHGRTLWSNALDDAEELRVSFVRRHLDENPDTIKQTADPTRTSQPLEPSLAPPEREQLLSAFRNAASGMRFVAIKWFRDSYLPNQPFQWCKDPEKVRVLLRSAIDAGMFRKEQIANPNNPEHPTTVLKEGNFATKPGEAATGIARRGFKPISITGKPLSATVLEGR